MNSPQTPVPFLNIQYFFQLLYELLHSHFSATGSLAALALLWEVFTVLAYMASVAGLFALMYHTVRLHQVREEEEHLYETIEPEEEHTEVEHSRWKHIMSLIESGNQSDWRQAIIEADIMLDETLARHGYVGAGVGERLKQASATHFTTLQDAWDAHKVRNDIAHMGSSYQLTDHVAYRTIQQYGNVFREFHEI